MPYLIGNNDWEYIQQVDDAIDDDVDRALFVGGVLYSHAYKGEHPDTEVEAVERDRVSAFFQEFIAEQLEDGHTPEDVLQQTFLAGESEHAMPDDWERPGGPVLAVPRDDIEAIKGEYEDFVAQNQRYTEEDLAKVTGDTIGDNIFGGYRELPDDAYEGEGPKHSVDTNIINRSDMYIDLVEEIADVAKPDDVTIDDISEAETEADLIYTNNVIDWFDQPEDFFKTIDQAGDDDGYYLELYTTGGGYGTEEFDSAEQAKEMAEQATGRTAEIIETGAESNVYQLDHSGDTERKHASYHTHDIKDDENHVLLYLE